MSILFKMVPHSMKDVEIVEIWMNDIMVGVIYPGTHGIRVVSKYMSLIVREQGEPETWRVMFSEHVA